MLENNETEVEGTPAPTYPQSDAQLRADIQAAKVDAQQSAQKEKYERGTVVAFTLLFVLPAVIIVLSFIFIFPIIARSLNEEPSGATTLRSNDGTIDQR
jgi:hypothetical protein